MSRYKGIIFDLDGTLLDTLEDLTDAVNHTMSVFELKEKTIEEVRSYVGNGIRQLLELCVPMRQENPQFESIISSFIAYYEEHSNCKTRPYDNVVDMLQRLKSEGFQMAIVSNKIDSAVKALNKLYFETWIPIAIGETKENNRKPHQDMIMECLKMMALEPYEVVYVGDSEVDIQTAKNAGIECISVDWGFRDADWLYSHGAKQLVSDVTGLYKALGI